MMTNKYSNNQSLRIEPHNKFVVYFFLILAIFSSCKSDPFDELDKKINIAVRSQNNVDENEWNSIIKYIIDSKTQFPELVEGEHVNAKKLTDYIIAFSQKRNRQGQSDPEIFSPKQATENSIKPQVKVFIENSGSMDGYVKGRTEFEAVLSDLLVQVQYYYDNKNLKVNFVNTKIYPSVITEVQNFVEALEPEKAPYKVGDRTVSKLNEILKGVLDSTAQNNISILISDCIYSLEKKNDTEGALEFEKSLTKGAFLEKSKQFAFATIVVKLKSKFTGNYWNKDNKAENLIDADRPFYIWIIGPTELINEFSKNVKTKSFKGFEHSYFLSNFTKEKQPYYSVLKETYKIGSFRPTDRSANEIKSISNISYDQGILQFSIAIDLRNIPVDSSYIVSPKNYRVSEGFSVKSIEKIDRNKLSPRDMLAVEKTSATHFITISTTSKYSLRNLNLELSNTIPEWVTNSSTIDDRNVSLELDKTFGLSYLVQGVSEAYALQNPEQSSYFMITVNLKK